MRVVFRPEARSEAHEAQTWYELRSPGLGLEFARALDAAVATIVRAPSAHRPAAKGCRQAILKRFPYSLVFRAQGDEILVVAVFHHRREPNRWQERV